MTKAARLLVLSVAAFAASPLLAQAAPSPSVPTLGEVGLALFAAGLVAGGTVMLRRKKR